MNAKILFESDTFTVVPFEFTANNMVNEQLKEEQAKREVLEDKLDKLMKALGVTETELEG